MNVRNINGTSGNKCNCDSWIAHWGKFNNKKYKSTGCSVVGCREQNIVGAHVQSSNPWDNNWYIIPLCDKHNKTPSKETLTIYDDTSFAAANVQETCGK